MTILPRQIRLTSFLGRVRAVVDRAEPARAVLYPPLMLLLLGTVISPTLSADTVELKTGESLQGAFRQADTTRVVIEAAGQTIDIPFEKVRAIYLGATRASSEGNSSPIREALDALKALRSVTQSGVMLRDYSPRVLDAKVKVDRYLSSSDDASAELPSAIRAAMNAYELALRAFPGHWSSDTGASPDPYLLKKCPFLPKAIESAKLAQAMQNLGITDTNGAGLVNGEPPYLPMWSCAAIQISEADRLLAQR